MEFIINKHESTNANSTGAQNRRQKAYYNLKHNYAKLLLSWRTCNMNSNGKNHIMINKLAFYSTFYNLDDIY